MAVPKNRENRTEIPGRVAGKTRPGSPGDISGKFPEISRKFRANLMFSRVFLRVHELQTGPNFGQNPDKFPGNSGVCAHSGPGPRGPGGPGPGGGPGAFSHSKTFILGPFLPPVRGSSRKFWKFVKFANFRNLQNCKFRVSTVWCVTPVCPNFTGVSIARLGGEGRWSFP